MGAAPADRVADALDAAVAGASPGSDQGGDATRDGAEGSRDSGSRASSTAKRRKSKRKAKRTSKRAGAGRAPAAAPNADARRVADDALRAAEGASGLTDDLAGVGSVAAEAPAVMEAADFSELLEFFLWGAFRMLPARVGGGELSETESRMLGRVWSRALLPYVERYATEAPFVIAAVVTGEVLMKRAVLARVSGDLSQGDQGGGSGE